jgi:hypothetical protein
MLTSGSTRSEEQRGHLAQVRALSQAVASAITAIANNDLHGLEAHLAEQETICNRLSGSGGALSTSAAIKLASGDNLDALMLEEIRQAHLALAQQNRVYSALLKRSRRSLALISALYRSPGEGYDRNPSELPQRHSWSCEV